MSEATFAGSGPVRAAHRFDEARLAIWMADNIDGFSGPVEIEQFKGGQSNPTYRLVSPRHSYVLRRKPPGELLKGAHAIEREARVMQGVARAGFPVPFVHGICMDDGIIGTAFYIMDMVQGRILWDPALPTMTAVERAAIFDAMNTTIADLHMIDPSIVGLDDFGRQGGYFERQIARWTQQYRDDQTAGRDPNLDRLADWLPVHIPPGDETCIVHGDFRLDNMIFAPDTAKLRAVLDWELSTLGHPLADFAYHMMMYRMPAMTIPGLLGADLETLGIPSEVDYIASYCKRTNRSGIPELNFYLAFNFFRFAAICHGIKGRLLRGTAASDHAARLVADLPVIAELGWRQVVGAPLATD